jgi:hypothetical protein
VTGTVDALIREPIGEWIGMRTGSHHGVDGRSTGVGMAGSALYDSAGLVGRSVRSLFVDSRE